MSNSASFSGLEEPWAETPLAAPALLEGIVLKAYSGQYVVHCDIDETGAPRTYFCSLRGVLKKQFTYSTGKSRPRRVTHARQPHNNDVIAVGDRVRFTLIDSEKGMIEEVLPRSSRFARSAFRGREQTMITNLDQLVIVFAAAEPNPDLWRLDRWLVAAESYGLDPLIVANKSDRTDAATLEARFGEFERIGYRVIATSAKQGIGIDALRIALRGRVSAFTGPSGVGKSSILNVVQPGLHLATGEIGEITFKGKHTTTVRELIPLDSGGWVADTPGLRQLDLLAMSREDLMDCFLEFRSVLQSPCRFRDCKHENEPDCELKKAVAAGAISARRYESFLRLAQELEAPR